MPAPERRRRAGNPLRLVLTAGAAGTVVLVVALVWLGALAGRTRALSASPQSQVPRKTLLSARRTPHVLSFVTRTSRVNNGLTDVLGVLPQGSCLTVDWLGTGLRTVRANDPLVPGSVNKIITAAVALEVLGKDATFGTAVRATDNADGTVADLFLVGGGDPLLTRAEYVATEKYQTFNRTSLETLADSVVAAGVRTVTGRVVGVDTALDQERYVAEWPADFHGTEAGPLGALMVDDGAVIGSSMKPDDPALSAATEFAGLLAARGVVITGGAAHDVLAGGTREVASIQSAPLSGIINEMLVNSDNNTAEILLKQIGLKAKGEGSTAKGVEAVLGTLAKWGLTAEYHDGSGLASSNRVSCSTIAALLERDKDGLPALLAVAGRTGTLREMFNDSPLDGVLVGKTGTLSGVKALAGYVPVDGDDPVRFVLLLNKPGIDNKTAYRPVWAALARGLERASAGPRASDLAP